MKAVSLRTRLEEPVKHILFSSAEVSNCKVQICEVKTSAADGGCAKKENKRPSHRGLLQRVGGQLMMLPSTKLHGQLCS